MFDRGPSNDEQALRFLVPNDRYMLMAEKDRETERFIPVLAIELYDIEWRFYRQAWQDGERFDGVLTDRRLLGCSGVCRHKEDIFIPVDGAWLEAAAADGASIKLIGRNGDRIVAVEPSYAQLFLDEMRDRDGSMTD